MPRHSRSGPEIDFDTLGPVNQNSKTLGRPNPKKHASKKDGMSKVAHHAAAASHYGGRHQDEPHRGHSTQGPQASSLPGHLSVIQDVQKGGRGAVGVPGIISSTTLGPEVRHRLVSGIIVSAMGGHMAMDGPVSKVQGHDATAYNEGMVHLRGSQYK